MKGHACRDRARNINIMAVTAIPEPGSVGLLALGALALLARRRRRS